MDGVADTPEKMDRYIKTVYNKANDMNVLINELSLYSKIDSNIIPYNFEKININSYFKDCVDEIGADLEQRGMMFSYRNYCAANVMVTADPEQLKRVINNIINNACKYNNKAKGKVGITLTEYDRKVQVAIKDNGIEFPKKIFHIFLEEPIVQICREIQQVEVVLDYLFVRRSSKNMAVRSGQRVSCVLERQYSLH